MQPFEIISIITTLLSVVGFSVVITVLFKSYARSTISKIESGERDIELIDELVAERANGSKKKVKKAIKTTVFVALLVLIVPLLICALVNRIAGGRPVLGKSFMVVASGSMSQKNEVNDYLFTHDLDGQFGKYDIIILSAVKSPEELEKFDIIAYRNDEGKNIIHRIVDIIDGEPMRYVMRGDANSANDIYKPTFEDVIGVYTHKKIGAVGIVVMFLQSYPGIITVLALLFCMFMIDAVTRSIEKSESARSEMLKKAIFVDGVTNIIYKGYSYRFPNNGSTDKVINEAESDDGVMIRTVDGDEPQKIKIETRKNDGKDQ